MADQPKTPSGWSTRSWGEISASDYPDAASYCSASLMDFNPSGQDKIKDLCKLPVKEPNGNYNVNGVLATAGGRGITRVQRPDGVSQEEFSTQRRRAARRIISLYRRIGRVAPESVFRIAGMRAPANR